MRKALGITIFLLSVCIVQFNFAKRKRHALGGSNRNVNSFRPVYSKDKKFIGCMSVERKLSVNDSEKKEVVLVVDLVNNFNFSVDSKYLLVDVSLPVMKSEINRNSLKVFDLESGQEVCEIHSYITYRHENKENLNKKSQIFNVGFLRFAFEENQLSIYHTKGGKVGEPLEGAKSFTVGISGPYILISFEDGLSKLFEVDFFHFKGIFEFDTKKSFLKLNSFAFKQDANKEAIIQKCLNKYQSASPV